MFDFYGYTDRILETDNADHSDKLYILTFEMAKAIATKYQSSNDRLAKQYASMEKLFCNELPKFYIQSTDNLSNEKYLRYLSIFIFLMKIDHRKIYNELESYKKILNIPLIKFIVKILKKISN